MQSIFEVMASPSQSLICVGPLSSNIVQATIQFSEAKEIPFVFIASRHQIDAKELGGGYAERWDTETFGSQFAPPENALYGLGRDHGGPWQGTFERLHNLSAEQSMAVAKRSLEVDIDSGFQFLHLDPSVPAAGSALPEEVAWERLKDLYSHVVTYARKKNKKIHLEVGTEEQSGDQPDVRKFERLLAGLQSFTRDNGYPMPLFVVLQTGTKVRGIRNTGVFEREPARRKEISALIRQCADIARSYGCYIKEHNTDYLSAASLALRPAIGIKGVNLAPELGAAETGRLLALLHEFSRTTDLERFRKIVLQSGKWKKWVEGGPASEDEKVLVAGHYSFSHPEVKAIKSALANAMAPRGLDLENCLRHEITNRLAYYIEHLGFPQ